MCDLIIFGSGLGGVDGMKSSPGGVGGGGPGTPREDSGSGMGDYNLSEYTFDWIDCLWKA